MGRKTNYKRKPQDRKAFQLPGVGDGIVDPDFDGLHDAERAAIEGVVGHERAEDQD